MELIDSPGVWWLPKTPEKRLHGTLKHVPHDSIHLYTFGALGGNPLMFSGDSPFEGTSHDLIHGISQGKPFTLRACVRPSCEVSWPSDVVTAEYHALQIYKGVHLPSPSQFCLSEWHVELTHFQTWLGETGF